MAKKLAVVALSGFAIAIAAAVVAISLGGPGRVFPGPGLIGGNLHLPFPPGLACAGGPPGMDIVTRRLPWTGNSDQIELDLAGDIDWTPGTGTDVIVTGPAALADSVRIAGNRIISDCQNPGGRGLTIDLPGRAFSHYEIDGLGKFHLSGLNQPALDLVINGAGLVEAAGVVPEVHLDVSGAASVNLDHLINQELHANLAGASSVVANPAQTADINLSGFGQVTLLTRPKNYRATISGLGHVSVPDQAETYE